jgi:hypothetical protein
LIPAWVSGPNYILIQKLEEISAALISKSFSLNVSIFEKVFVSHTEMAAQGGIRDKILRVSMPFEKGRKWTRKLPAFLPPEKLLLGSCSDARSVVLKVHSWVAQLQEGKVKSCAEIARREGITRARVSQLWPLSEISRQQADDACTANMGREISLRRLIKVARNPDAK